MKRYAVVWPEGQHEKAVFATGPLHCFWLQFWVGVKTHCPTPAHAKRVTTLWLVLGDPFNELEASVIAYATEDGMSA